MHYFCRRVIISRALCCYSSDPWVDHLDFIEDWKIISNSSQTSVGTQHSKLWPDYLHCVVAATQHKNLHVCRQQNKLNSWSFAFHGDFHTVPNSLQKRVSFKLLALSSFFHGDYCKVPNSSQARLVLKLLALTSAFHYSYCTLPNSSQVHSTLKLLALPSSFHSECCTVPNSLQVRMSLNSSCYHLHFIVTTMRQSTHHRHVHQARSS